MPARYIGQEDEVEGQGLRVRDEEGNDWFIADDRVKAIAWTNAAGEQEEVEGHFYKARLDQEPEVEGHVYRARFTNDDGQEQEVEGHILRGRLDQEPEVQGHGLRARSLSDEPEVEGHAFTGVKLRDPEGNEYELPADRIVSIKWTDEQGEHEVEGHVWRFKLDQEPDVEGHWVRVKFTNDDGQEQEVEGHRRRYNG